MRVAKSIPCGGADPLDYETEEVAAAQEAERRARAGMEKGISVTSVTGAIRRCAAAVRVPRLSLLDNSGQGRILARDGLSAYDPKRTSADLTPGILKCANFSWHDALS